MKARVALFGGTFDPIHRGHLFIAERARERCGLERVIFLPCWQSPHKPGAPLTDAAHRLAMTRLATSDLAWAETSAWEIERGTPSYSWQTAQHFREIYPERGTDLFWIMGADQWRALATWNRPDFLAALVRFIVFPRHGQTPAWQPRFRAEFLSDALEQSATSVRAAIAAGQAWADGVPVPVAEYIQRHGLYQQAQPTSGFDIA